MDWAISIGVELILLLSLTIAITIIVLYYCCYLCHQAMNLLGFFQIQCGWLPFTQMVQDGLQTGDVGPNLLGLIAGHFYFYCTEVTDV